MKKFTLFILLIFTLFVQSQNEQLALDYYEKGEFEKALTLLEQIALKQTSNYYFFERIIDCYQQLEQFEKAENAILERKKRYNQPILYIDLGYNFQLQKQEDKAKKQYELALKEIEKQPAYAYQLGNGFEKKVLVDWALKAYEKGQQVNPELNFDYQIALLQGQLGNIELMTDKLLDFAYEKQENTTVVQNYLTRFIADEAQSTFLNYLKKALLIRTQKKPDVYWNQFLSWLYVQQKEYAKAFIQEKAIYKRNPESFNSIVSLAYMAFDDKQNEEAISILNFVLENTNDKLLQVSAHTFLMKIRIEEANPNDYVKINTELNELLEKYGFSSFSLELIKLTAHFQAFNLNNPKEGIILLNKALELRLNSRDISEVKMELADILIYDEKFNQAILYYAQVEENMKNDVIAHEASMKMAKANYYKNDFDWALQQVKVLKQSSSLLIANDAVELFLLIKDNSYEDSTRVALTSFARADLLLYQNKEDQALNGFISILEKYKGDSVEDETLFKIAIIYTRKKEYQKALSYYKQILDNHSEGIYVDEALFFSAEIYRKELLDVESAKPLYEKMIFEHSDSIYFTEARKQFRILRGDANL
ncbi:tetratricopeptide repeat protein [Flavobacterium jejuense]|uniref:Tetratricopeptide repeat protein n=1 Tax=Flavobacterium jejuense TaxID=1544455 RepID=A0ABX0IWE8_9FLAO|nr:tetratricopeptide repeat protein [Flavobacterium jejuense]NHN27139.1 tetratricopeptide repeat protein [Flavobacterium jejuense]